MEEEKIEESVIEIFHRMWDAFPGPVRLIDQKHKIIAVNGEAEAKGFQVGLCCARVGKACSHRGCKSAQLLKTGCAQVDRTDLNRIRGWIPIKGYKTLYVHFTLSLPEVDTI